MSRPHIIHITSSLGLGGDAKNAVALASSQCRWARVSAAVTQRDPGPRSRDLTNAGASVVAGLESDAAIREYLRGHPPAVIIVHRNGGPNALETRLAAAAQALGHSLFEYNTFARPDPATDPYWTGHLHLSCASQLQYARRRSMDPLAMEGHAAVGYIVSPTGDVTPDERRDARRKWGIAEDAFAVARVLRPDLRKWDPLLVLGVAEARRQGAPVHLLVRAAPHERASWVRRTLGAAVTLLDPSADPADLRATLAASDCVANYSAIGETFGLALVEGLAAGLPALVNSTPRVDNAQVEWCRHGETGFVANDVRSLAAALRLLSAHRGYAQSLGAHGKALVVRLFEPNAVDTRISAFVRRRLVETRSPLAQTWPKAGEATNRYMLDAQWLCDYEQRACSGWAAGGGEVARVRVAAERLYDASLYARRVGITATARVFIDRWRRGALSRG